MDELNFYLAQSVTNPFLIYFCGNPNFVWSNDHDILMCREVLQIEPFQFKIRSPERGQAWESLAEKLNANSCPKFRVTARSVRDRYNFLTKKMSAKLKSEEKASDIQVETSELDDLLEEILEKKKAAKEKLESDNQNHKAAADDMRKQALERMGQTAKRKKEGDDSGVPKNLKKKSRRSTTDAVKYLKERADKKIVLKEQELDLRKKEQENIMEREKDKNQNQENLLSTMVKQQQQQQQMMMMMINQQQQQSQAFLAFMQKFVRK